MNFARFCFVTAVVVAAVGCSKPKEGGTCTTGHIFGHGPGTCIDKQNALVCVDGVFTKLKCKKSATGCMDVAGNVSCDPVKEVGEACPGDKENDCSTDGKKWLTCDGGKWKQHMACSKLCVSNVKGISCENVAGAVGDPCTAENKEKDQAECSVDKLHLLLCDGEKWYSAASCRGQNKCRAVGKQIQCDTSMAELDDACEEEGTLSCDTAKKTMLKCVGKKFVTEQACKRRCNNAFNKFSCD